MKSKLTGINVDYYLLIYYCACPRPRLCKQLGHCKQTEMESKESSADVMEAVTPVTIAEADNFMDFSDTTPAHGAAVACIARPHLSADWQTVYEDTSRSGHVLAEMHRLYLSGRLCDVVLCVDSERIPCHRLVMAASSVYFERMFSNDMTESRSPEVI